MPIARGGGLLLLNFAIAKSLFEIFNWKAQVTANQYILLCFQKAPNSELTLTICGFVLLVNYQWFFFYLLLKKSACVKVRHFTLADKFSMLMWVFLTCNFFFRHFLVIISEQNAEEEPTGFIVFYFLFSRKSVKCLRLEAGVKTKCVGERHKDHITWKQMKCKEWNKLFNIWSQTESFTT